MVVRIEIHPKTLGKLLKTCTMYIGKSEDTITYLENDFRVSRSLLMTPSRHPSKFMKFHKFSKFINFFDFFTFYKTMKSGFSCPKIHPKTLGKLLKTCAMYRGKSEDTITYLQNDFRTSRSNSKLKRQKCPNGHSGDILKSATVCQI